MVSRFLRFPGGKSRALTLSYDDGVIQDLRFIEIMKKYGLKGTFNINAGLFSPEDKVFPPNQIHRRMKASEILKAYPEEFCEVACHGYTHPWLEQCDPANATAEVLEDRRSLEAMFDRRIQGMAYPYGTFSDQVVEILKNCGICYSRTTVSTEKFSIPTDWLRLPATCHHNNPRLMELVDQFLTESRYPQARLFYLWGHTYEFDTNNNWQVMEEFAAKISGHEDIWYATNMEIYDVCKDFDRLESTADGHIVYNLNARTVWFADRNNQVYKVEPGETVRL